PSSLDEFPFQISEIAKNHQIPFLMVESPGVNRALTSWLTEIHPDVVFVMLWPFKVSASVLSLPRLGFFNCHPALFPQFLGPDPVFWEIKNREPFGGITVHQMNVSFDAGPIVSEERIEIPAEDGYVDHFHKLTPATTRGTEFLLSQFEQGTLKLAAQDEGHAV